MFVESYYQGSQQAKGTTFPLQILFSSRINSSFVYTKTSEKNMITLALAVSQGKPILLEGVTGSGKTAQISELADLTGNHGKC